MTGETHAVCAHEVTFDRRPILAPTRKLPDGPIAGNGDVGVVWGGEPGSLRMYLSKNDFWFAPRTSFDPLCPEQRRMGVDYGGIRPIGGVDIPLPGWENASYRARQRLSDATVEIALEQAEVSLTVRSWVSACRNIVILEMDSSACPPPSAALWAREGDGARTETGKEADADIAIRAYDGERVLWESDALLAMRLLEQTPTRRVYAICATTNHDTPAWRTLGVARARALDEHSVAELRAEHECWWRAFWRKSEVRLSDATLEKHWYAGIYVMACCGRAPDFPPGLFGNFLTCDAVEWKGDYHTNYNFEAAFWALYGANHVELTDNYEAPLEDYRFCAKSAAMGNLGCRGSYYEVSLGPRGLCLANPLHQHEGDPDWHDGFLGQKSDALYMSANLCMRFYSTWDELYALKIYPLLRDQADFWEDYLTLRDGLYISENDAVMEAPRDEHDPADRSPGNPLHDVNPIQTLGFLRMLFACLLEISGLTGLDANRRARWADVLERVSPLPTMQMDGKTVFAERDGVTEWRFRHMNMLEPVWPGGQIGLDSPPELLETARNTLEALDIWEHPNGMTIIYPAAARVGLDPERLLERLRGQIAKHALPNLMFDYGAGGVEYESLVPACLNEMMLKHHEGVLRFFRGWPRGLDASFRDLRCYGAFLASASVKGGEVKFVEIRSERGRPLTVENPWPGRSVTVERDGARETLRGERFDLGAPEPGARVRLTAAEERT